MITINYLKHPVRINPLLELRKARNMSLEEVGEKLGVNRGGAGHYELNCGLRVSNFEFINKISKIYDVSVEHIVYITSNLQPPEENEEYYNKYKEYTGKTLKELRIITGNKNLTKTAKDLNISNSFLTRLEKGERRMTNKTIYRMHKFYKVTCKTVIESAYKTYLGGELYKEFKEA